MTKVRRKVKSREVEEEEGERGRVWEQGGRADEK
jgi:hypothetical protein